MNLDLLPTLSDVASAVRLITRLPAVLRNPITSHEAHAKLQNELTHRDDNFLALVREGIYNNALSPYRRLLNLAGCEYGDLEKLVRKDGLDGALQRLFSSGVYLTVSESKGRIPIVRGNDSFQINNKDLSNPAIRADLEGRTGGSRSASSPVPIQFSTLRDHALEVFLDLEIKRTMKWVGATWSVPGGGNLKRLIYYSLSGLPIAKWFLLVQSDASGVHSRYRWSNTLLRWAAWRAGIRLPSPEIVRLSDPLPIIDWMSEVLRSGGTPYMHASVSCATRICQTAVDSGFSLNGVQFAIGAEPITAARLALIQSSGARAHPHYSSADSGHLGRGCTTPEVADEVHVVRNRYAVIQPGIDSNPDFPSDALLVTSILPKTRLILLNVSLGDQAVMTSRQCGCPFQELGWTTHLHTIRSFEKLTACGMTFHHADVIRVLEDTLPSTFGGRATDYQLVDDDYVGGSPRVRLLVHPRIGVIDTRAVRQTFLDAIGHGSGVQRVMMMVWRDAGLPIVEREAPRVTAGGKILHVHRARKMEHAPDRAEE